MSNIDNEFLDELVDRLDLIYSQNLGTLKGFDEASKFLNEKLGHLPPQEKRAYRKMALLASDFKETHIVDTLELF